MNEEDEFISVRRLRSTHTSLETSVKHSMNDEASLGLRPVGEPSETTPSHRPRKKTPARHRLAGRLQRTAHT